MELPRLRTYEGPPVRAYADMSYLKIADSDFHATGISPREFLNYEYGPEGINWDIALHENNPKLFDVVVYPDGQAYNISRDLA